jgi:DNA-binding MarR family transcriptional regulator
MAAFRLSRLQRHILRCLWAEEQRTRGLMAMGHRELVQLLGHDKSNLSHSLRTLEVRGLLIIGRTLGGKADSLDLTTAGRKMASEIA